MRVILLAAISTDGFIGRSSNELANWTTKEDKAFFIAKTKEAGVMVMGRTTFETIGRPLKGRRILVLTRNPEKYQSIENQVEYTSVSPHELVEQEKARGTEMLVIAGGAEIYSQFLAADLIKEMYLTIEPVLFGAGVPLARDFSEKRLKRLAVESLGEQSVLLHYEIMPSL